MKLAKKPFSKFRGILGILWKTEHDTQKFIYCYFVTSPIVFYIYPNFQEANQQAQKATIFGSSQFFVSMWAKIIFPTR